MVLNQQEEEQQIQPPSDRSWGIWLELDATAWEMADYSCDGPQWRTVTRTVGSVAILVIESSEVRSNGCKRSRLSAVRYLAILVI